MEVWVAKNTRNVFSTEEKGLAYLEKCRQESLEYHKRQGKDRKTSEIITWADGSVHYYKSGGCSVSIKKIIVDSEVTS